MTTPTSPGISKLTGLSKLASDQASNHLDKAQTNHRIITDQKQKGDVFILPGVRRPIKWHPGNHAVQNVFHLQDLVYKLVVEKPQYADLLRESQKWTVPKKAPDFEAYLVQLIDAVNAIVPEYTVIWGYRVNGEAIVVSGDCNPAAPVVAIDPFGLTFVMEAGQVDRKTSSVVTRPSSTQQAYTSPPQPNIPSSVISSFNTTLITETGRIDRNTTSGVTVHSTPQHASTSPPKQNIQSLESSTPHSPVREPIFLPGTYHINGKVLYPIHPTTKKLIIPRLDAPPETIQVYKKFFEEKRKEGCIIPVLVDGEGYVIGAPGAVWKVLGGGERVWRCRAYGEGETSVLGWRWESTGDGGVVGRIRSSWVGDEGVWAEVIANCDKEN